MRILTINADTSACGVYRVFEPVKAVTSQFPDITVSNIRMIDVSRARTFDVVIIRQPLRKEYIEAIPAIQRGGTKVIIDIDDDLSSVHAENVAAYGLDPNHNPNANWQWAEQAYQLADLVTCSSDALASKYKSLHGGAVVLPNCVPDSIFGIHGVQHHGRTRIGWAGHVMTHPNDLASVGSSVKRAVTKLGADFVVVGPKHGVGEQVKLSDSQFRATGAVPMDRYYKTVADNIDIGIAPLELSEFNDAKSYLKMLEYSALGIPSIGSATPENLLLHEDGIGMIAHTQADWNRAFALLLSNDRKREKMGEDALKIVKKKHTYSANAHRWADAWRSVLA